MVRALNQYLEEVKPWHIAKDRDKNPDAAAHLADVLSHSVATLEQVADLLAPFLPSTATYIKAMFESGVIHPQEAVLFPKIYRHTTDPHATKTA
ncbi:MAG TPA: methionine--tRNA ligase, partial [Candidatus Saccharimonadaceae bacterium]|nr:methionine--tRNA ligase [Candidatus Saccharimonadaceae bacterium]